MAGSRSRVEITYANCMADVIGPDHGLTEADLEAIGPDVVAHVERIWSEFARGDQRWMALPDDLAQAEAIDRFVRDEAWVRDVVLVGIGGSSLGAIATIQALAHPYRNLQPDDQRIGPRFFVLDNPDPEKVAATLELLDLSGTLVNVVTKSGQTAETMANFLVVKDALEQAVGRDAARRQIVATTDPESGLLRQLANDEGYRTFPVPVGVDGRMTVLSPVGLLPAAFCGVDIVGMLHGAAAMRAACERQDWRQNPGALLAGLAVLADQRRGKSILVTMPYADALYGISDWFRQLWAESLGKRLSVTGDVVHAGQTPIKALGAIDQHSQIQLYVEGPNDKLISLIGVEAYRAEVPVVSTPEGIDDLAYLRGADLGTLLDRERRATAWALARAERPNVTITVPVIDAAIIGELFFMYEFQTVVAGGLLGVDPFGQPGVEAGKQATYALMGREGYGDLREEIEREAGSGGAYSLRSP